MLVDEIQLGLAINGSKKLAERLLGVTKIQLPVIRMLRDISYSSSVKYQPKEQTISLLLHERPLRQEELYAKLGLDTYWGNTILSETLESMQSMGMVSIHECFRDDQGDDAQVEYALTERGEIFLSQGFKVELKSESNIVLYYIPMLETYTTDLTRVVDAICKYPSSCKRLDLTQSQYIELVSVQHPRMHSPNDHIKLEECISTTQYDAQLTLDIDVAILYNYLDKTYRPLAFLSSIEYNLAPELSDVLAKNKKLLNKLKADIQAEYIRNPENIATPEEVTQFNRSQKILMKNSTEGNAVTHFSTLEFEAELQRVFREYEGDIYIQSPWFGDALLQRQDLYRMLLDRGYDLYLCASEDEAEDRKHYYDNYRVTSFLRSMRSEYPQHFHYGKMGVFHNKLLLLVNEEKKERIAYSGSFNILSFKVDGRKVSVRDEEMNIVQWDTSYEQKCLDMRKLFK